MIPDSAKSKARISYAYDLEASSPLPQLRSHQDSNSLDGSVFSRERLHQMILSTKPVNPKFLKGIGMHTTAQISTARKHRRSESTEATEIGVVPREDTSEETHHISSFPQFSVVNRYGLSSREQYSSFQSSSSFAGLSRTDKSAQQQQTCLRIEGNGHLYKNTKKLNIAPNNIARKIRLCKQADSRIVSQTLFRTADLLRPDNAPIESIIQGVAPSSNPKVKLIRLLQKS